jgi:hypothetical protein
VPITGNFVETVLASSAPGMPRTFDFDVVMGRDVATSLH